MTQAGNNLSIQAWATRLVRVLAEVTGSKPAIRRVPFDESEAPADMLWWGCPGPPAICVGVSEVDAQLLLRMRERALPGETPDPARASFADVLDLSLGRGEIQTQGPADPAHRELYKLEFAAGGSVSLFVVQREPVAPDTSNLDMLMDIQLPVTLRFGRTQMALRDIAGLSSGSVIEFDRGVDDPVEVMVNGHVVARGEAVMIKGSYGVRIAEISSRRERLLTSSFATAQDSREPAGEQIG